MMSRFLMPAILGLVTMFWAGLWVAVQYQIEPAAEFGYAVLFSTIGVAVGGSIYRVATWISRPGAGVRVASGVVSFFAAGILWGLVTLWPSGHIETDGQQLGFFVSQAATTLIAAIVGAVFGAGVGQGKP